MDRKIREEIAEDKEWNSENLMALDLSDAKTQEEIKMAVNNLLHMYLPGKTTLEDMEVMALVMYRMITRSEDYLNSK